MRQEFPYPSEDLDFDFGPHRVWWGRGIVMEVREVERPTGDDKLKHLRDTQIKIGDVDRPLDGYEVRIEGNWHNIEDEDAVSLLGHELVGAERASVPRLFINHHTGQYRRAYPPASRLTYGVLPIVERKYWLAGATPADPSKRRRNGWILAGALALPWLALGGIAGPVVALILLAALLLLASPFLVATALLTRYFLWLFDEPRFSWEKKRPPHLILKNIGDFINYERHDYTEAYERLAEALHAWAVENPAPDLDWVPMARGVHTVGLLEAPAPAPTAPRALLRRA